MIYRLFENPGKQLFLRTDYFKSIEDFVFEYEIIYPPAEGFRVSLFRSHDPFKQYYVLVGKVGDDVTLRSEIGYLKELP